MSTPDMFNYFQTPDRSISRKDNKLILGGTTKANDTEFSAADVEYAIKAGLNQKKLGWGYYNDNQYTEASPLAVNNARVQVPINGLGLTTEKGFLPPDGELWDAVTNDILMDTIGQGFNFRLDWKAKSADQNAYYDMELDIGDGASIVIIGKTIPMIKGVNIAERFSETISGFALANFVANGARIFLDSTADGSNISIYDIGIKVERTFSPIS